MEKAFAYVRGVVNIENDKNWTTVLFYQWLWNFSKCH